MKKTLPYISDYIAKQKERILKMPYAESFKEYLTVSLALLIHLNTGELIENSKPETGFGIINTTQRLHLLYGDLATFAISNSDNHTVLTRVSLPKEPI